MQFKMIKTMERGTVMDAYDLGLRLKGLREKYHKHKLQHALISPGPQLLIMKATRHFLPRMLSQSLRYYIIPQPIISLAWKTVLLSHLMDSPLHKKMTF